MEDLLHKGDVAKIYAVVGITRYDPGGNRLYGAGIGVPGNIEEGCDFPNLSGIRQLKPAVIEGRRRLVYCSPIVDTQDGLVGFDVLLMADDDIQSIVDAGGAKDADIMILFVSEDGRNILFEPDGMGDFLSPDLLRNHLDSGAVLPGYITRVEQLSPHQWRAHAVVNEGRFFAGINRQLAILIGVVAIVMVIVFGLTVAALRPIIRTLVREAELLEMSHRDGLTKLYNYAFMQEQLDREVARARRNKQPMSVIMFDIDFFKQFNDEHGHQTGDEVLRKVASTVKRSLRQGDSAARYGGEEFMTILPNTPESGAETYARRLLEAVAETGISRRSGVLKVTISIGTATYDPELGDLTKEDLIRMADEAMYESKNAGRNQVTAAAPRVVGRIEGPEMKPGGRND